MTKNEILDMDLVAVRFTADWCGPCKQFAPTFEKVGDEFPDINRVVVNVGAENGTDLVQYFGVLGIPAVVFLKKGVFVSNMAGNQPTDEVKRHFQKLKDA